MISGTSILKHLLYKQAKIWYGDLFKVFGPTSFIPNDGAHSRNHHCLGQRLLIPCFLSPTRIIIIYSTALVIIILIDNLKCVIIFVFVWFLPWKISEVSKNACQCTSKRTLGRLIVQTFTTHVSNHLINFPMCTECKKEGQKPIALNKVST